MQLPKVVLLFVVCATGSDLTLKATASPFQDTARIETRERKTVPLEQRLKLDFEDPVFREFVGIPTSQSGQLDSISNEWTNERTRLAEEGASRREQFRAFATQRSKFENLLNEKQKERLLRFNLISSYGVEEFALLELAKLAGDLDFEPAQIEKLEFLRKKWIQRIDQELTLPTEKGSDDRERRWEMLNERVRRVQAIRQSHDGDLRSALDECLTQQQSSRLAQIQLQKLVSISAIEIFNDPFVKSELKLTPEQTEQLAELKRKIASAKNAYLATGMKLDAYRTYVDTLSPGQKKVWQKQLGPPVWFFNVQWLAEHIENEMKHSNQ